MMDIIIPVAAMTTLGLAFGLGLAYTLKLFGIEVDPTVALIITKLPGANCGVCGRAGCVGFAEALKKGETAPSNCVLSEEETRQAIAKILDIEYIQKVKKLAIVLCQGGKNAVDKYAYQGIKTCKASALIFEGYKACIWGCLGFGDCADVCPFGAIDMIEGLPRINPDKCVACGKCVEACPKHIISLEEPDKAGKIIYVACSSHDKGAVTRKICSAGCITCGICQKLSDGGFEIKNNLSIPNYEKLKKVENKQDIVIKCPTKVIKMANAIKKDYTD